MVHWRPIRPDRMNNNNKKRCSFHHRGLECKNRKSRDIWINRQVWPWSTKWSRGKLTVLPRECTSRSKHPPATTQEKTLHMDITRWSIRKWDWLSSLQPKIEKLHTISKKKYQELTVAQIMNSWLQTSDFKLKKVGKTTRSFRYDLNQIPYNYTVEVTSRFKGLDLIDRVPEELWTKICDMV